ncbi:hypothetical protein AB1N83_012934, partial [Pleurotus pulmonarius]
RKLECTMPRSPSPEASC